ncbi:MAG TPA: DNA topoisomerase VI subunit B, partial [Pirellulaceae bacterium]|nr:DNA topoisomerase VI subunit B [Pirellulaceae bacterium]
YGMLTTGKPVKIVSKLSPKKPAHYYEIQIDTKRNHPEILNGKGEGEDIPPGADGHAYMTKRDIDWHNFYPAAEGEHSPEVKSGTRVTIELEAKFHRGRGSVEDYLEQTAIANPHVTLHYKDPEGEERHYIRATDKLPPEPKEIKPHPYGIELGRLLAMLKDTPETTLSGFLCESFSRVSPDIAKKICDVAAKASKANITTRSNPKRIGRQEADALFQSIQETKISAPATDCICPIGEELLIKGLYKVVPGEFYCAATRPPSVYRGNPFQIEVALAYGGSSPVQKVTLEALTELLSESDARTMRQFLLNTFDGVGSDGADRILTASKMGTRQSPGKLSTEEIAKLHSAMHNVNLSEGQSMQVLRYANRVPLQFQPAACAITQSIIQNNWRAYGLNQSRGSLPQGPVTVMVHMASVWVPFTSESKEAIAGYPEIQKELRLGLQAVGRKLGMFLNRRHKVKQEGERRSIFLRYLREVAGAVNVINDADADALYENLLKVAKKKTEEADLKMDDRGRKIDKIDPNEEDYGGSVLIVNQDE